MKHAWKKALLSELLEPVTRREPVQPFDEYRLLGIRLEGRGPFHRETKMGSQIRAPNLSRVSTGDFLYSRLFAWRGAFGCIGPDLDGCYVSDEFPTFVPVSGEIDIEFLRLWFRLPSTISKVEECCMGSTPLTRNRFKEPFFLGMEISIPPIEEQRRIVDFLTAIKIKVDAANNLRREAIRQVETLMDSAVDVAMNAVGAQSKRLSLLTSKIGSGSTPRGGRSRYLGSGIPFIRSMCVRMRKFSWDKITFIDPPTHAAMMETQVKPNDVLLNITGASIGRVACAPSDLVTGNVSQHVTIIRPLPELDHRYLMYWLSQPSIQSKIGNVQKGATRQALTKSQIEALEVPLPSLSVQHETAFQLDTLQRRLDSLRQLQAGVSGEIGSLFPSVLESAFRGGS